MNERVANPFVAGIPDVPARLFAIRGVGASADLIPTFVVDLFLKRVCRS